MLEKRMKPKNFKLLVYLFGILLEIVGFGLLFNFSKVTNVINSYPTLYAIGLIFGGYLMAISVRR